MVTFKTLVMANLGCKLDWIWNQLRDKMLGTPVVYFLDEVIWSGKIQMTAATSDSCPYKIKFKGKALHSFASLPLCLFGELSILFESSSIQLLPRQLLLLHSFTDRKTQHIQTYSVNWRSGLFKNCIGFQQWLSRYCPHLL